MAPQISPSSSPSANCHHHHNPSQAPSQAAEPINFNIMVIVAAMLCAVVCALGLNSMLQCVFQCTHRAITEPRQWVVSRRLNSGLKKKEMIALPTATYATSGSSPSSSSAAGCAICLLDFIDGDEIRLLPKCNHRFHVACIDQWLPSHSSCPTCRHRLKSNIDLDQIVTAL
ncbi:RING-H2 finger protein [Melia azedarach]|uniref:RING-H2 finger protein n=1 Tax=Melia azedarach TaxID=155640 RepID=A0ACC1WWH3_MELAZ|nr:RING-H2 finger protein [Melia azedarach]